MSQLVDVTYDDLHWGLNLSPPHQLKRGEMSELVNWYPFGGELVMRGGSPTIGVNHALVPGANGFNLYTGMRVLKRETDPWRLILGTSDGDFFYWNGTVGSTLVQIPPGSNDIGFRLEPWDMHQYKNFMYAIRTNTGRMYRIDPTTIRRAGTAAPVSAPTVLDTGIAGNVTAGVYKCVYTYYNTATGYESNPSPEFSITLAASRKIFWGGFSAPEDGFPDAVRMYRTLPDQTGEYFFVKQIDIPTALGIGTEDNVAVSGLGRAVSFSNGVPNEQARFGDIWQERLFTSDGRDVFYSEILNVEAFDPLNVISVFPDDGQNITGIKALGDRLIIGKDARMYYLFGTSPASFALHVLSDSHGVTSYASMATAENRMFWHGSGPAVYMTDGTNVRDISTARVQDYLTEIPASLRQLTIGTVYPTLSWYVLLLPTSLDGDVTFGRVNYRRALVYNYSEDSWTTFEVNGSSPFFPGLAGGVVNKDGLDELYAASSYGLSRLNDQTVNQDLNNSFVINAAFKTGADPMDREGYQKFMKEVWLNAPHATGTTTINGARTGRLQVWVNQSILSVDRQTVFLDTADDGWHAYKLPSFGQPGNQIQVRYSSNRQEATSVRAIHLMAALSDRRPTRPR